MYGYIYKITNNINGKMYIGMHRSEKFDESYWGSGVLIKEALDKYGKDNFIREIIKECYSEEELCNSEKDMIEELNCVNSDDYYNLKDGGAGKFPVLYGENNGMYGIHRYGELNPNFGKKHKFSESSRKNMSDAHIGKHLSNEHKKRISESKLGKKLSESTKKKISEKAKQRVGWHHSESTKIKMSKNNAMNKKEYRDKVSNSLKGKNTWSKNTVWMNRDGISKMIRCEDVQMYLDNGFKRGRK